MKLSVCVDAVYWGRDFYEGLEEVRSIGYEAIEFWDWWTKDVEKIARVTRELGLHVASVCTKPVGVVDASRREDFLAGVRESIAACRQMGCKLLIIQAGQELEGVSREEQQQSMIEGLRAAAPILEEGGVTAILEPLNTLVDHKGYYLYSSAEAFHVIREVGSPNVKVVFDIYHQQIMEGNLLANILPNLELIAHFHAAGNPGRHELSTGELHYGRIFEAIEAAGYDGYMGLEYFPVQEPAVGLKEAIGS